jgi:hypothetical protein
MANTRHITWYDFYVDDKYFGDTRVYDCPGASIPEANIVLTGYTDDISEGFDIEDLNKNIEELNEFIERLKNKFYYAAEIKYVVPYSLLFQQNMKQLGEDYEKSDKGILWTTLYGLERKAKYIAKENYPHVCRCNCKQARIVYY